MEQIRQLIADGINKLGWAPDVPNEKGEMKFSANCHEVMTIAEGIEKLIDAAPVVYGCLEGRPDTYEWSAFNIEADTHKARLMLIEPIKKECVKHEPINVIGYGATVVKCKHCDAELVPEWRAK